MSQRLHPSPDCSAEACALCAAGGCSACFEEILRRYQSPLLHFLCRRLGSRHDAEDVLQETFLIVHRKIGRYRASWRLSTWLFTIAHRLAVSSRRRSPMPPPSSALGPHSADDPPTAAAEREMHGNLWDAAQKILEPDAFAAVWLSYVEAMSAAEIGEVLGRNANAVRILLHRARAKLGEQLDGQHVPERSA